MEQSHAPPSGFLLIIKNHGVNEKKTMIDPIFVLFLVGILIAFLADFAKIHVLWIFAGVWYIGNSVNLAFTDQGFVAPLFFALSGLVMVFVAIQRIYVDYKLEKQKEEQEYYEEKVMYV